MRYRTGNRFTSAKRIYSKLLPVLAAICICTFNISAVYADTTNVREENVSKADTKAQETNKKLQSKTVPLKKLNQNHYNVIIVNSRSGWRDMKTYVKLFALVIIGVVIVSVFIYFIFLCKAKKVFKKNVDDFDKCEKEIEDTAKQCAQIINNELYRQKNMIEKCLYGNSSAGISGIIEMSENLDDDLYSRFDLAKYIENDFCEKMFKEVEQWKTDLKDILFVVFELKEEERKRRKQTVKKISAHKRRNAMIKVLYHKLGEKLGKVKTIKEKAEKKKEEAEKILQDIEKTGNEISALTCNKITCKLTVKDISCCPGVRGVMNARGFNGNYIHRYYSLGAVELITAENLTLGDKTGSLDIYVYGCGDKEPDTGEAALKLKGTRNFIIEDDDAEETTPIRTTDILLMAGHTYTLTVEDTQIGSIQMKLVVQQG